MFPRVGEGFAPANGTKKVQPFRQKRSGVVDLPVVAAAIALKTGFLIARKICESQ